MNTSQSVGCAKIPLIWLIYVAEACILVVNAAVLVDLCSARVCLDGL